MTNSNYSKLVEKYLDGQMSSTEVTEFEQMVSQDPMLSNELGFQQEIINGLQEYRKTELKTRLNNIDVTPGLFESLATNTAVQATSVALLTGSIFVGSYFWVDSTEKIQSDDITIISKSSTLETGSLETEINSELPLIELRKLDRSSNLDEIETVSIVEAEEEAAPEIVPLSPDVLTPQLADAGSEDNVLPKVAESIEVESKDESKASRVEIENIATSKKTLKYKFYNNKLYLYGDFKGIPYEILEINNRSGKRLFLYHNDLFYRINNNVSKSTPLRQVTNRDLIKELMILKENKSE